MNTAQQDKSSGTGSSPGWGTDTLKGTDMIATTLSLDGHDAELMSFLSEKQQVVLQLHRNAERRLFTFGESTHGVLKTVSQWNGSPGCFVFRHPPEVVQDEPGWINFHGYVTRAQTVSVQALPMVRYIFQQFWAPVSLDGRMWIEANPDPTLERLAYIRGYGGQSTESPEWEGLCKGYFEWAMRALEQV